MFSMRRTPANLIRLPILLGFLGAFHGLVFAQDRSVEVPEHAHAKSYGDRWECDKGYREVNGGCAAVKVPANAYPTNKIYGRGWECNRGFLEVDTTCLLVKIPSNAYLNSRGDGWK